MIQRQEARGPRRRTRWLVSTSRVIGVLPASIRACAWTPRARRRPSLPGGAAELERLLVVVGEQLARGRRAARRPCARSTPPPRRACRRERAGGSGRRRRHGSGRARTRTPRLPGSTRHGGPDELAVRQLVEPEADDLGSRSRRTAATAEGQKTRPITDASCTRDFCSVSRVSSRAAMMRPEALRGEIDRAAASARAGRFGPFVEHPRELLREQRVAAGPLGDQVADVGSGVGRQDVLEEPAGLPSLRGASETMTELRIPPPHSRVALQHLGSARCRRSASGSPSTTRARARRTRPSRAAPSAGPRSAITSGRDRRDRLEEATPGAEGLHLLDRSRRGSARPTSGARRARSHSCSAPSSTSPSTQAESLSPAVRASSDSRMPACALHDLAERPVGDALAVGEAPPLSPRRHQVGQLVQVREELAGCIRLLPTPGSPSSVTSCTDGSRAARAKRVLRGARARPARPTNGVDGPRGSSAPNRLRAAFATQTGSGSAFPLTWTGSSGS